MNARELQVVAREVYKIKEYARLGKGKRERRVAEALAECSKSNNLTVHQEDGLIDIMHQSAFHFISITIESFKELLDCQSKDIDDNVHRL